MLEKTEVNDKRCGRDQSTTASKTLNVSDSYNECRNGKRSGGCRLNLFSDILYNLL